MYLWNLLKKYISKLYNFLTYMENGKFIPYLSFLLLTKKFGFFINKLEIISIITILKEFLILNIDTKI